MTLKKCILTANDCYKAGVKITNGKPVGIVVHETAAGNTTIKRYVQPLKTDSNYSAILADLGTNANSNHWNQAGLSKCVHAFIGKTANGSIATYQTLPFDYCCWGCGTGSKGSYNKNPQAYIQFEICDDKYVDGNYFDAVYKEAVEFCVYLCKQYGISTDKIVSHAESYKLGYGSNHGDPDGWFKKFNKTMNDFRAAVKSKMSAGVVVSPAVDTATSSYTAGTYKITQVTSLNVRKGSGTGYSVVKSLPKNTVFEVTKIENKAWGYIPAHGGWCNISTTYCTKVTTADIVYTVAKGDKLSAIAKKYGTTADKLAEYNKIPDKNKISIGQKIKIPGV